MLLDFVNVNTPNSERVAFGFGLLITIVLWSKYPIIFPILQRPKHKATFMEVNSITVNVYEGVVRGEVWG